jgi:predicted glycoside hydrolase/deacetylase ChbG (UPF0249 family)
MRTLIFNADDYGLSPAVSSGIREAQRGVVRSTTVMANIVTPEEAHALKDSGIGAGLHLNLSCGRPLSPDYPEALLKDNGCFDKALALTASTWQIAQHLAAAQAEWQAQLDRADELGLTLTHLDSHHHAHLMSTLFAAALALAAQRGLALRCRAAHVPWARNSGVRCPDTLVEGFFGVGNISQERLLALLDCATGQTVEVMCHPGRVDCELVQRSGYVTQREAELAVLGDAELRLRLEDAGWRIGGYLLV